MQALSLPRTTTSLLDLDFSFILLNTITCLISLCVILMSPSFKSSVGLVTIGRSTQLSFGHLFIVRVLQHISYIDHLIVK